MGIPITVTAPGVTACFRYTDILDYKRINEELPKDDFSPWTLSLNRSRVRHYQKTLTIAQVFKYTPPISEALAGCRVRTPKSYNLIEEGYGTCSKMFRVQKFFVLEYMCYKYQLYLNQPEIRPLDDADTDIEGYPVDSVDDEDIDRTSDVDFTFLELTNTPAAPGLIFSVTYKPKTLFDNYKYSKFIVHRSTTFPYKAVGLSPVIDKANNTLSERSLTYFRLKKRMLRSPFVTNCFDYKNDILRSEDGNVYHRDIDGNPIPYQSQTDCHQVCVKRLLYDKIHKIPFSSIETRKRNLRPLSYEDVMNATILDQLLAAYKTCSKDCARPDCYEVTTFTRVTSTDQDYLEIVLNVQNEPSIEVIFQPTITFPEYFTYFLSCFGTWFGISVLALNPFKRERVKKLRVLLTNAPHKIRSLSFKASNVEQGSSRIAHAVAGSSTSLAQGTSNYNLSPIGPLNHLNQSSNRINASLTNSHGRGGGHVRSDVAKQVRVLEVKIKQLENVIDTMKRDRTKTM